MRRARPEPLARGNFSQKPFAHILVYLMRKKIVGTLEIIDSVNSITIYFRDGMPAKVKTTLKGKDLGNILVDSGKISIEQLIACQKQMATQGGLAGQILIKQKAIDTQTLINGLQLQMMLKIVDCFLMQNANYAFYEHLNLLAGVGPDELIQLDTYSLLAKGIRQHFKVINIKPIINSLQNQWLNLNHEPTLKRFIFNKKERDICRLLLNKKYTANELIAQNSANRQAVHVILYVLTITQTLKISDNAHFRPSQMPPSSSGLVSTIPPVATVASYSAEEHAIRDEIQQKATQIASQNYFEMLDLSSDSSIDDARKSFFRMAKKYHPDKASKASLVDLKGTLEYVFSNLSEAHSTLIDQETKSEYISAISSNKNKTSKPSETNEESKVREMLKAENMFQKALVLMRRQQNAAAIDLLDKARQYNPSEGEYLGTWAYLKSLSKDPNDLDDIIGFFRRAEQMNPASERIHLFFGKILLKTNRSSEAQDQFERVLKTNPNNIDAQRSLRLISMRKSQTATGKNNGFFGRFLK